MVESALTAPRRRPSSRWRRPRAALRNVLLAVPLTVTACGAAATPSPVPAATTAPTTAASISASVAPAATPSPAATAAASPTVDPLAFAALFAGSYTGTWKNTTYGSTGAAGMDVALDRPASQLTIKLTLGGNVFGAPAPAPETLVVTIGSGGALTTTSKTFGPMQVAVARQGAGGTLTVTASNVPSTRIATFTATATVTNPAVLQFDYTVTFRDGTPAAKGTATLNRS